MFNFFYIVLILFLCISIVDSSQRFIHGHRAVKSFSHSAMATRSYSHGRSYNHNNLKSFNKLSMSTPADMLSVQSIIPGQGASNNWWVWSLLATSSSLGIMLEKTRIGAMLSSPLVTMGISLILCNIGVLPSASPAYSTVLRFFVPLAIPLLLLDADLRKCFKNTGTLLKAFLIGSIGTFMGTLVAYSLVPMKKIVGSHKIAAALCARHIGGAVNFVSVSDILQTSPELVAAALAADNVVVAIYFAFLFAISRASTDEERKQTQAKAKQSPKQERGQTDNRSIPSEVNLRSLSVAISLGLILCATSQGLSTILKVNPILLVSSLAVVVATAFPKAVGTVSASGGVIGVLFMQMFFAVTGAMGHVPTVIRIAPSLFLHTLIQIIVHFSFSLGIGKLLKVPFREIVLASNANVGGPTTAAAMASSKKWRELVLPALLTGIFGYVIATGLGLLAANILPRIPTL